MNEHGTASLILLINSMFVIYRPTDIYMECAQSLKNKTCLQWNYHMNKITHDWNKIQSA